MDVKAWTISREVLLPVLEILDLVPSRPAIPASNYLLMEPKNGRLEMAAAAEVSGRVWVTGQGKWPFGTKVYHVDRRLFLPFMYAAKKTGSKAPFEFLREENSLVVRQGRRRAIFAEAPSVSGYGDMPNGSGTSLRFDERLSGIIACARECATVDTSVPHLNCVYLQPKAGSVEILSTNQIIMQYGTSASKLDLHKALPFPLHLVELLKHKGLKKAVWGNRELTFHFEHGAVWQTVSVPATKSFPVKAIFERMVAGRAMPEKFRLECKLLATVVTRLSAYLNSVRRIDWVLNIIGAQGTSDLTLEAKVPQSTFKERVRCSKPLAADVNVDWPLDNLLPVFQYLGTLEGDSDLVVRYEDKTRKTRTQSGKIKVVSERSPYLLETKHLRLVVARLIKPS